jgi:hypothetical protein
VSVLSPIWSWKASGVRQRTLGLCRRGRGVGGRGGGANENERGGEELGWQEGGRGSGR